MYVLIALFIVLFQLNTPGAKSLLLHVRLAISLPSDYYNSSLNSISLLSISFSTWQTK